MYFKQLFLKSLFQDRAYVKGYPSLLFLEQS